MVILWILSTLVSQLRTTNKMNLSGKELYMENMKIVCKCIAQPFYAISVKDGRKTFDMQAFDGVLTADVQYDFNRRPLRLSAEVKDGDSVEIVLLEHRIELYVNGELCDEDFIAGMKSLLERNVSLRGLTNGKIEVIKE